MSNNYILCVRLCTEDTALNKRNGPSSCSIYSSGIKRDKTFKVLAQDRKEPAIQGSSGRVWGARYSK